jgi:hypothetical protein
MSARSERVALVDAIVSEGDQLARWEPVTTRYSVETLRWAKRKELQLIANRFDFDATFYSDNAVISEILTRQAQRNSVAHDAREERVNQAQERIAKMADRLRVILPDGMRLGDYLNHHKHDKQKASARQRPRPAARIY